MSRNEMMYLRDIAQSCRACFSDLTVIWQSPINHARINRDGMGEYILGCSYPMRHRALQLITIAALLLTGCTPRYSGSEEAEVPPDFEWGRYKVDTYIEEAVSLQSLDHRTASERLLALASDNKSGYRVIILCRMLFTKRHGSDFRRPRIGGAVFLGGTDYSDWPLEPIELVDGVPFLITQGYTLYGLPESRKSYLQYCLKNCDWSTFHFAPKTNKEKSDALNKLIASRKWRTPLDSGEREFLSAQIISDK